MANNIDYSPILTRESDLSDEGRIIEDESKNIDKETNPEEKVNSDQKPKRNSLLELYRFLFAMWVVYYHGYFVIVNRYFNNGYIAVEFFFILSGFFLIKSINKYIDKPFFKGLWGFLWKRIKALGLPMIIGSIFVVWYMFIEGKFNYFGFLWYVPFMLLAFILMFLLKKYIKNEKIFVSIVFVMALVCYLLLYIPVFKGEAELRAIGGVSLGVLLSYIPKIKLKVKRFDFNWLITAVLCALTVLLAFLPKPNMICEYLLIFLLMPALIYFTNNLEVNCKFLNFLGSISFGLYAYQCVIRVLNYYVPLERYWLFMILVGLVLIDRLIVYLFNLFRRKRRLRKANCV